MLMVEVNIDLWEQKRSQPLESICRTHPPTPSLVVTADLWLSNLFFWPKIHRWKRSAKRQSSKILAISDTTASYGKPWLSQKFKVIAHSATLCFQRTPKLAMGVTHGSCCEQDGCQRNDCAAATMLLFLFLPVDSSLVFVFSRISFLSIASTAEDFFFFFFITSHMFLCVWNLNPGRLWTPHTQSQKPWSCQCLRDEGWIPNLRMCHTKRAREKKVFMFPFVSPVPPPISGQLCLFCSSLTLVITCRGSSSRSCSGWFRYKGGD